MITQDKCKQQNVKLKKSRQLHMHLKPILWNVHIKIVKRNANIKIYFLKLDKKLSDRNICMLK